MKFFRALTSTLEPPLHPAEPEHPLALLQQLTSCWGERDREDTLVPAPPWIRYMLSIAAVAAKAQQEPGARVEDAL